MVPLHQLPIEIFVRIITRALEPYIDFRLPGFTYLARLVPLRQVCRHWKDVIEGTPSLWSTIDILDPAAITSTAISRSAGHPLNIIAAPSGLVWHSFLPSDDFPDGLDEFINTAMTLSTRWRSVQLVVESSEKALAIINTPAPFLQTLELKSTTTIWLGSQKGEAAFQGSHPQLRRLGLYGVAIQWDSCLLRGLQHLHISEVSGFAPSCEEILGILGACPGLVGLDLSLEGAEVVGVHKKATPFTLTELRSLSTYLDPSWTLNLLETVCFPLVESVSLNLDFNNSDSSDLYPKITQHIQALFPVVFKSKYKLRISSNGLHWGCEPHGETGSGREFKITARRIPVRAAVRCLFETILHRFPATSIEIELLHPSSSCLAEILQESDGLDGINLIKAYRSDLDAVLAYMSGPTTRDLWGFPELEELFVCRCDYDPERLLNMVKARYGLEKQDGSDLSDHDQPDLPPPLKRITISHSPEKFDRDTLALVEDIIGPECFELHEQKH
ncbi:hypothetical protein FRC00_006140 [Tulasnella sp. 408]|nr:hypothetical protein FRC00_006140 [Tulasnella sp. 408]